MASERRLIIAIDCDDVLVPTAPAVISAYNEKYSTALGLEDFYGQDPARWGVKDLRHVSDRVGEFLQSDEHAKIIPDDYTVEVVQDLASRHELHLVTGRGQILEQLTLKMITKYFPGCFKSIELTNFYDETHRRSKGDVCRELGADILVDDHIEHIHSVLAVGMKEVIVFGDYPWNQAEQLPAGATRCRDWNEVRKEIRRVAGQ